MSQRSITRNENFSYNIFPNQSYIDFFIVQCGWEACKPLHSYGPSARNHFLFHYILSGKGTYSAVDSNGVNNYYHLSGGQGFLIWPHQQTMYSADEKDPWEYTWIEFDGLKAQEVLDVAGFNADRLIYESNNPVMQNVLREQLLYMMNHSSESMLHLIGHFYLFMDALHKSSINGKPFEKGNINNFYVEEAISFIENNYFNGITVEDIATYCNLNRSYFSKIFKDITRSTPQDFLIRYRMGKACEFLKDRNMSIAEVGALVGYHHPLRFSRAFKNVHNVSPREWRYNNVLQSSSGNETLSREEIAARHNIVLPPSKDS